jgi:hypothetical protein
MAERPPTTIRVCIDTTSAETDVVFPETMEGAVARARIVGWRAVLGDPAATPFIQVKFEGGLSTHTVCYGDALRADCVQLPYVNDSNLQTFYNSGPIPVRHSRDFPTRLKLSLYNADAPPKLLSPVRFVIILEIDLF